MKPMMRKISEAPPFVVIVKNTSNEPQDAYLFDQSGKLNSKDIRIDSGVKGVDYDNILKQIKNNNYFIAKIYAVSSHPYIEGAFVYDEQQITLSEKKGKKLMESPMNVNRDPYQYQNDMTLIHTEFWLNKNVFLKFRLKDWTRIMFKFYYGMKK